MVTSVWWLTYKDQSNPFMQLAPGHRLGCFSKDFSAVCNHYQEKALFRQQVFLSEGLKRHLVSEAESSSRTVQPSAGTGSPAAIFCPTKRPSWDENQPGLHRRLVSGSGQWLLTHISLHRMEISAREGFIISWRREWETKRALWKAARCCFLLLKARHRARPLCLLRSILADPRLL